MSLLSTSAIGQDFEPVSDAQGQAWLASFDRLQLTELDQARAELNKVKDRALETNDPELLVAYAQRIFAHFRYSEAPSETLDQIQAFSLRNQNRLSTEQDLYLQLITAALQVQLQSDLGVAETTLLALLNHPDAGSLRSTIQQTLGDLYQTTGQYPKALAFYTDALRQDQRPAFQARIYNNMGNVTGYLEDWEQSIGYYEKAIELNASMGWLSDEIAVLANLGPTYRSARRFEEALATYQRALQGLESFDSPDLEAQIQMNLGNLWVDMGQPQEALQALKRSLEICTEEGYAFCVMLNHLNMGHVHYVNKDYGQALEAYRLASQDLETMADPYVERQLMANYRDLYRAMGEFESALDYANRFQALDRQLINAEAKSAAEEIQTRYETELKDAQLSIQAEQIQRQKLQLRLGVSLALVIVSVLGIIISALSFRARALQSLYERNQDLLVQSDLNQRLTQVPSNPSEVLSGDPEAVSGSLDQVFARVTRALQHDQVYKNPNLTLNDLAAHVASNSTYVSNAISQYANSNFNNLINYHRIMDARRALQQHGPAVPITDLMHRCGFNSKASFYRAFSKFVGMSPSQYLHRMKANQRP